MAINEWFFITKFDIFQRRIEKNKVFRQKRKVKTNFVWEDRKNTTQSSSFFDKAYIRSIADTQVTDSKTGKAAKMMIFIFTFAGFVLHSAYFIFQYFSYETLTSKVISTPTYIERPAFTVCDANTRRRTTVCSQPSKCTFLTEDEVCSDYPHYCSPDRVYLGIFYGDPACHNDCFSWKQANDEKLTVFYNCFETFVNFEDQTCKSNHYYTGAVPFTSNDGEVTYCYTSNSQLNIIEYSNDFLTRYEPRPGEYQNISILQDLHYALDFRPADELLYSQSTPSFYIAVHDPRQIVNPFREGVRLEMQTIYRINILGVTEQKLLPAPYDTNCVDLNKEFAWSGSEYMNTAQCVEKCEIYYMKKDGECIPRYLSSSHLLPLCPRGKRVPKEITEECVSQCGLPCLYRYYDYEIEVKEIYEPQKRPLTPKETYKSLYKTFGRVSLIFSFEKLHQTYVTAVPKMTTSDLFSNIGGCLGIWIGVSLISLLDLVRRTIHWFLFSVTQWMDRRK